MSDKEKIIWITGASSGIGKSIALKFAGKGMNVAASARNGEQLEKIKNNISGKNNFFNVFPLDISNPQNVADTGVKIFANSQIDCLINNAGVTSFTKAADNSIEEVAEIINTNLLGAIYAIKSVLPEMIKNERGTIINILSVVTEKIFTESSAYSASKAGLLAYSKVLREELRDHNIRIINVIPGATRTPIWPNQALEKFSNRMIAPDDLAELVFNLYSDDYSLVPEEVVVRPMKGDL